MSTLYFAELRMHHQHVTGPDTTFGDAIREARGGRSIRSMALRAGISEGRWRQLENGHASAGRGAVIQANPKPETAAEMARAVGLDPAHALQLAFYDPSDFPELLRDPIPVQEARSSRTSIARFTRERQASPEIEAELARVTDAVATAENQYRRAQDRHEGGVAALSAAQERLADLLQDVEPDLAQRISNVVSNMVAIKGEVARAEQLLPGMAMSLQFARAHRDSVEAAGAAARFHEVYEPIAARRGTKAADNPEPHAD